MVGRISMGARREVLSAVADRYRTAGRHEKGRILDELTATTGWHRKHAVRALSAISMSQQDSRPSTDAAAPGTADTSAGPPTERRRKYGGVRDALVAPGEASDRACGKRLGVMIPKLLPALARHQRAKTFAAEREPLLSWGAA